MKRYLFFLTLCCLAGIALAQNPPVAATVDRQQILIGEPIALHLQAYVVNGQQVPWFSADTIPHFEILKRSAIDTQVQGKGLALSQTLTITSWDSGRWLIPSFFIGRSKTKPLAVAVGYTPMAPNQPYNDIKDIVKVAKPIASNWYWYLLIIAVLIALFALFFPSGKKETAALTPAAQDPYTVAMQQLQALQPASESKQFFTRLTDIFRTYLKDKRNIESFSKTTSGLCSQIKNLQLPGETFNQLQPVLHLADLVKFARWQATAAEKENALRVISENLKSIEHLPE